MNIAPAVQLARVLAASEGRTLHACAVVLIYATSDTELEAVASLDCVSIGGADALGQALETQVARAVEAGRAGRAGT